MVLIPKKPTLDDTPLTFGKHKGLSPNDIVESDPQYIVWMHDNIEGSISNDLYETAIDEVFEQAKNSSLRSISRDTKHNQRFMKRWS